MQKKVFLNTPIEIKGVSSEDPTILKIGGFANTTNKDRGNEIITADAWKKGVVNYKNNPVILFDHKMDKPIGRATKLEISDKGLYIEAEISSAAERLYGTQQLIKDGALKAFSVGFYPLKGKKDTATDTLYITELELLETSVVSVPMNQDSIFAVLKSVGEDGATKFSIDVEEYDSTKEVVTMKEGDLGVSAGSIFVNSNAITTSTITSGSTKLVQDIVEGVIRANEARATPIETYTKAVDKKNYLNFVSSLKGNHKLKIDNQFFFVTKFDTTNFIVEAQEVTILGKPINNILKIDYTSMVMLNLDQIDSDSFVEFKAVPKRENAEIEKLFKALPDVSVAANHKQLTTYLKEKAIKDWNSDDYVFANQIITYIEATKKLLVVEEKTKMDKTTDENTVVAPVAVSVQEPAVLALGQEVSAKIAAIDTAKEEGMSSQIKDLQTQLASLTATLEANKERFAAASNEKVNYGVNNGHSSTKYTGKDIVSAMFMAYGRNPGLQTMSIEAFRSTKLGADILQTKATITTVDALITDFTSEIFNQMRIALKIAPLFKEMEISGQHFKIPVADEDTNGDISMFQNGTYNLGKTDSTRVPTTRQNVITAVDLTPHKFMGTTHLAKDEQEDVLIPLLQFQIEALVNRMARAIDKSLLRGDGSLTGFTASPTNAITAGTGYQSVITGIASLANAISGLKVPSGGNSTKAVPSKIAAARALLGRYGLDNSGGKLVYITSIEGYNDFITTADFQTVDTFGESRATYITGQVGSIYGIPLIVSEFMDNVGVSGNHIGLLVWLPGFIVGRGRALEMETDYDPRRQITEIYLSTRFDMKALTTVANAALNATGYSYASLITSNT